MEKGIKDLLDRRKNRSIAIIMAAMEESAYEYLPEDVASSIRKVTLDQINDFYNLVLDVLNSMDNSNVALNKYYLDILEDIHSYITEEDEYE